MTNVPQPKRMGNPLAVLDLPVAVRLCGDFTWNPDEAANLVDLDLAVATGQLVMVVGHTGCGKSSLLNAMLGMMTPVGASAEVYGSVAYVPQ